MGRLSSDNAASTAQIHHGANAKITSAANNVASPSPISLDKQCITPDDELGASETEFWYTLGNGGVDQFEFEPFNGYEALLDESGAKLRKHRKRWNA